MLINLSKDLELCDIVMNEMWVKTGNTKTLTHLNMLKVYVHRPSMLKIKCDIN